MSDKEARYAGLWFAITGIVLYLFATTVYSCKIKRRLSNLEIKTETILRLKGESR